MNTVSKKDTNFLLIINVILIIICIYFNLSLSIGFLVGICITLSLLKIRGFRIKLLLQPMLMGIKSCSAVLFIIALMGGTIAIWLASGIVPTIIYYGYNYIGEINFLFASFLIAGITSIFMGTALGTFSTIGMALFGLGISLGIQKPMLLGAITSGVFLADKISPISSLTNLTLKLNDISYKEYMKVSLRTVIPTIIICMIVFYYWGSQFTNELDINQIQELQQGIKGTYNINTALLLFPLIIIVLAIKGVNIIYNMVFGIVGGALISLFVQKLALVNVIKAILFGYKADTSLLELNNLLQGGGAMNMLEVIFIVILAVALTSLFEGLNFFEPLVNNYINKAKTKGSLITRTAILSSALTVITCDQTVGILLPSKLLKDKYKSLGLKTSILARTISDSGTSIAPLMAWNVNAIIITSITGVSAMSYGIYTVLCYVIPLVTVMSAYLMNNKSLTNIEGNVITKEN
ncbi:Na+/H+ antiporter NhaC family protein [Clostridium sp.]|uniref:Na+/H+ antiporter NhaC family protein n=1 Tax=Clostridium sp. TaxID=1506 RepID=UPI002FCBFA2A